MRDGITTAFYSMQPSADADAKARDSARPKVHARTRVPVRLSIAR